MALRGMTTMPSRMTKLGPSPFLILSLVAHADVGADAGVLVEDGVLDDAAVADAEVGQAAARFSAFSCVRFVAVGADDDAVFQDDVVADLRAHADDAVGDLRASADDAAVADEDVIEHGMR